MNNESKMEPAAPSDPISQPVPQPSLSSDLSTKASATGETLVKEETLNPQPFPASPPVTQPSLPHKAKGESDRAFEAFRIYLELGPRRRFSSVGKQVGASQRSIRRWAYDFDWKGRIKTYAAQRAEQYAEDENTAHREELVDAAARAKSFRERQYSLAEAILDAAEQYLERVEEDDLDQMNFADACKALEVASRLGRQASTQPDDPAAQSACLRDQLAALLDQAYGEVPSEKGEPQPSLPTTASAQVETGKSQPASSQICRAPKE